jgi:hypothetical protein
MVGLLTSLEKSCRQSGVLELEVSERIEALPKSSQLPSAKESNRGRVGCKLRLPFQKEGVQMQECSHVTCGSSGHLGLRRESCKCSIRFDFFRMQKCTQM